MTYSDILTAKIVWLVKARTKDYIVFKKDSTEVFFEIGFSLAYIVIALCIIYILKFNSNSFKKKNELKDNILYMISENKKLNEIQKKKLYTDIDKDQFVYKVVYILDTIKKKSEFNQKLTNDIDNAIFLILSNKFIFENLNIEENHNLEIYRYLDTITDYDSVYSYNTIETNNDDEKMNNNRNNISSSFSEILNNRPKKDENAIRELLKTESEWNFDIFKLNTLSDGQPLFYLGRFIFEKYDFRTHFNIKQNVIDNFLRVMESQYHMILPYHNNIHACDVLHAVDFIISFPKIEKLLTIEEKFACIISAIIHDIDHPGVNNIFEIKYSEPLSVIYNNKSVLENHHCALAFKILNNNPKCNILKNLTKKQYSYIRSIIITMILSTDMANHKKYIDAFTEKINNNSWDFEKNEDRNILLCMIIKCADISNPSKENKISMKWSNRLFRENKIQNKNEQKRNYQITPYINQSNATKSENQIGFINIFVKPSFELITKFIEIDLDKSLALKQIESNIEFWKNYKE